MFGLGSRKKESPFDRRKSLAAVPVLNKGVTFDDDKDGNVVIHMKLKRSSGFSTRYQPPVMERAVKLDELGSFVFRQIDGHKSTLKIIDQFIVRYRTNRREAELSTIAFLKSLVKRGIVSVVVK